MRSLHIHSMHLALLVSSLFYFACDSSDRDQDMRAIADSGLYDVAIQPTPVDMSSIEEMGPDISRLNSVFPNRATVDGGI